MFVKWFIYPPGQNRPIGIKYDYDTSIGYIGGAPVDMELIVGLLTDYFGVKVGRKKTVSNKIRFKFQVKRLKFKRVLDKLDDRGYVTEKTTNLKRIFR